MSEVVTNTPFVAKLDAIRYGRRTSDPERPFEYLLIFVTRDDGSKLGLLERKPQSNTVSIADALKEGETYEFPTVLIQSQATSKQTRGKQ